MSSAGPRKAGVGRFIDVSTAALRPPALEELAAYGLSRELRGARVIDIGSGDGRLAFGAHAAGAAEVVGVDPDPVAIRAARRRARDQGAERIAFRIDTAQDIGIPRERFDIAFLSWTL